MHVAGIKPSAAALAAAVVFGGLVVTPAARAAITGSQITTPTDPSFLIADQTAATQTFAISGTTTGGKPSTDKVDVRCYYHGTSALVAKNVALSSDGSFSVPAAGLDKILDLTCRLRAVPAGLNPLDLRPYSGPLIGVGERDSSTVGGGPNDGRLYDYYLDAPQQTAAFDYASLGSCGLHDGYLFDMIYALTTTTFYCNAALFEGEKGTGSTRSELQIDGTNAYAPDQAESVNANAAGLPALSYSYTVDAHTGNVVIHETDPLVKCPAAATYPPTTASCASFVAAGVTDNRTIAQDHDGHVSWIADTFTSTDGHAHSLDLLWDNSQHFRGGKGDSSQVEYQFPGQSSFSTYVAGDDVSLPASSPGTILVRMHGALDGDFSTGQGAIVYDRPAAGVTFTSVAGSASELTLHQTGTVPAGGSTRFRFAYVQDFQAAKVASVAQEASAAFLNTIAVTKSGKGKVKSSPGGILCGKTCSHGYVYGKAVTLRAVPAKGFRFLGWSGPCKRRGFCTIRTTANVTVKARFGVRRCVVPNVVGKTLKAARRALTRADCSTGKVTMVQSSKVKSGRVVAQKPKRGKHLRARSKIRLVVSGG